MQGIEKMEERRDGRTKREREKMETPQERRSRQRRGESKTNGEAKSDKYKLRLDVNKIQDASGKLLTVYLARVL